MSDVVTDSPPEVDNIATGSKASSVFDQRWLVSQPLQPEGKCRSRNARAADRDFHIQSPCGFATLRRHVPRLRSVALPFRAIERRGLRERAELILTHGGRAMEEYSEAFVAFDTPPRPFIPPTTVIFAWRRARRRSIVASCWFYLLCHSLVNAHGHRLFDLNGRRRQHWRANTVGRTERISGGGDVRDFAPRCHRCTAKVTLVGR